MEGSPTPSPGIVWHLVSVERGTWNAVREREQTQCGKLANKLVSSGCRCSDCVERSLQPRRMPAYTVTMTDPARAGAKMDVPEDLRGFNLLFFVTEVIGLVGVVLMAVWTSGPRGGFAWRSDPGLEFNWHPLLNTIGMIYLFANSILVYRALRTIRKKTLKLIHAAIHFVVIVLVLIAGLAVLDSHNLATPNPIPNFYSLHSWLGIVTILVYVLQWVFGFAAFLYPGFPQNLRGAIMPVHTFLGLLAFVLAIATAFTGLTEKALFSVKGYSSFTGETYLINFMGLIFLLFGGLVVYLATEPKYKRYPRPEDGGLLSGSSD